MKKLLFILAISFALINGATAKSSSINMFTKKTYSNVISINKQKEKKNQSTKIKTQEASCIVQQTVTEGYFDSEGRFQAESSHTIAQIDVECLKNLLGAIGVYY